MDYSTADLRNLLSLAKKLRRLAIDTPVAADRELYVSAAEVLEKRADWLATHLPEQDCDPGEAVLHRHVDVLV